MENYHTLPKNNKVWEYISKNIIKILLIASCLSVLLISCGLLNNPEDKGLQIKLEPKVSKIGESVNLVIKNNTNEIYRYHRGHGVEKRDNDHWVRHQQFGTFQGPVDITPGEQYIQENIALDVTEPGVYRVVLIIRTEEEPFPDTRRPSDQVEFVENGGT